MKKITLPLLLLLAASIAVFSQGQRRGGAGAARPPRTDSPRMAAAMVGAGVIKPRDPRKPHRLVP